MALTIEQNYARKNGCRDPRSTHSRLVSLQHPAKRLLRTAARRGGPIRTKRTRQARKARETLEPPGSRSAGPTADGESIAAQTELELLLAAFETAPTISSVAEMNARHAATALGLDPLEEQLLLLVLRSGAPWQPIRKFLDAAYGEVQELPRLAAALLGAETHEVEIRLQRSARLATCGLVSVDMTPVGDFSSTARLLPRVARQMRNPYRTAEAWVQALLGEQVTTPLCWQDFAHVHNFAEMAARLLRRAAHEGEAGVHVLLVGPAGTGKTELAKALAARAVPSSRRRYKWTLMGWYEGNSMA